MEQHTEVYVGIDVAKLRNAVAVADGGRGGEVRFVGEVDAELELADAALHAEQQAVIGVAWVVNAIQVDDPCLDQAAQFEQMMPIAAIARQARRFQAQDRTNFSSTQGRHEPLETGAGDRAACAASEIVVDNLDLGEPGPSRHLDQLVLTSLALQVLLNLLRR